MKLRTVHVHPPIPVRAFDWCAYDEERYDGAPDAGPQIIGWGTTETDAIYEFLVVLDDKELDGMRVAAEEIVRLRRRAEDAT
jgi:hypothetical protein